MNAKKVKKLRAIAKTIVNRKQAETNLDLFKTHYSENKNNRKMFTKYKVDANGNFELDENKQPIVEQTFPIAAGTVTVADNCFRGIYKSLKKSM